MSPTGYMIWFVFMAVATGRSSFSGRSAPPVFSAATSVPHARPARRRNVAVRTPLSRWAGTGFATSWFPVTAAKPCSRSA